MDPDSSRFDKFSREYIYGLNSNNPEKFFQNPDSHVLDLEKIKYKKILKIVEKMFIICNATPFDYKNNTAKLISFLFTNKLDFISKGANSYRKTSPLQYSFFKEYREKALYLHSEIQCIKNSLKNKKYNSDIIGENGKWLMIVVRSKKNVWGNPIYGISFPCKGCRRALKTFNVKTVVYTLDQPEWEKNPVPRLGVLILKGDEYVNLDLTSWWSGQYSVGNSP